MKEVLKKINEIFCPFIPALCLELLGFEAMDSVSESKFFHHSVGSEFWLESILELAFSILDVSFSL